MIWSICLATIYFHFIFKETLTQLLWSFNIFFNIFKDNIFERFFLFRRNKAATERDYASPLLSGVTQIGIVKIEQTSDIFENHLGWNQKSNKADGQ